VAVPIELDSELDLRREEIQHKGPNAVLPAKLASQELTALEPNPEHYFGIGHGATEFMSFVFFVFAVEDFVHGGNGSLGRTACDLFMINSFD
jgi:hypothetical protein